MHHIFYRRDRILHSLELNGLRFSNLKHNTSEYHLGKDWSVIYYDLVISTKPPHHNIIEESLILEGT